MSEKTIALLGQPNSGKSTLFNGLTGSRQHVGNWPGKTVERKDGSFVHKDTTYKIIDLPVYEKYYSELFTGAREPKEMVETINEELEKAGWETIREEAQKQIDAQK